MTFKKQAIVLCIVALCVIASPVMAHDGYVHASDAEVVVSGIGIILITLSVASLIIGKKQE